MTQITVKVDGGEVLISKMKQTTLAVEELPKKEIRQEMQAAMEAARTYPPEFSGQRYVRTGTYGRSFKLDPVSSGYAIKSDAAQKGRRYTVYVGGRADGTGQVGPQPTWPGHAGRWKLILEAVQEAAERIRVRAEEKFRQILGAGPGGL